MAAAVQYLQQTFPTPSLSLQTLLEIMNRHAMGIVAAADVKQQQQHTAPPSPVMAKATAAAAASVEAEAGEDKAVNDGLASVRRRALSLTDNDVPKPPSGTKKFTAFITSTQYRLTQPLMCQSCCVDTCQVCTHCHSTGCDTHKNGAPLKFMESVAIGADAHRLKLAYIDAQVGTVLCTSCHAVYKRVYARLSAVTIGARGNLKCAACHGTTVITRCACDKVHYCSEACRRGHWDAHQFQCASKVPAAVLKLSSMLDPKRKRGANQIVAFSPEIKIDGVAQVSYRTMSATRSAYLDTTELITAAVGASSSEHAEAPPKKKAKLASSIKPTPSAVAADAAAAAAAAD